MSSDPKTTRDIGEDLSGWVPPSSPPPQILIGQYARLERLTMAHCESLFSNYALDTKGLMWTYLPCGPFNDLASYRSWMCAHVESQDPFFYAIIDPQSAQALGVASYLRIMPTQGSIEMGYLMFSPRLQRTRLATESMYMMMSNAFEQGYRRYEWKCDALNLASRQAALRLGFEFEGVFRQCTVYKGRNRDTAWYSIIDRQWPSLQHEFTQWLDPANFDQHGKQYTRLQISLDRTRKH